MRHVPLIVLVACAGPGAPVPDPALEAAAGAGGEPDMVPIAGGRFELGSPPDESGRYPDEGPITIEVGPFRIDRREVTAGELGRRAGEIAALDAGATFLVEADTPAAWPGRCNVGSGRDDHPATCVSFRAARAYCRLRGGDLPTEAEWERAARSGGEGRYGWGDAFDPSRAVTSVACGERGCAGSSSPVVSSGPRCNAAGVCDLTGNAWEWTATEYEEQLGPGAAVPAEGVPARPVIRGGGWVDEDPGVLRLALRGLVYDHHGLSAVGFRCVKR